MRDKCINDEDLIPNLIKGRSAFFYSPDEDEINRIKKKEKI